MGYTILYFDFVDKEYVTRLTVHWTLKPLDQWQICGGTGIRTLNQCLKRALLYR